MIQKKIIVLAYFFCFLINTTSSQINSYDSYTNKNENSFHENDATNPCITQEQYALIERRCAENSNALKLKCSSKINSVTQLTWPIQAADGFTDYSYYFIAAYVDEDTTAVNIKDFNCGNNTYDGHRGTDIAIWPFGFYKMDNSQVEVVAAAPGTIIDKSDGNFDRNCSSNNLTANYVVIQHADGGYALYWHMKKN